jgi:hypothetical protein
VGLKSSVCTALVLLASLAGLAACGENNDQRAARDTVTRFYAAFKAHDAKTACALVSTPVGVQLIRSFGERGNACVPGLEHVFRRVEGGQNPGFFDESPTVRSALVRGDHAVVVVRRGYQRRSVGLTRRADGWRITKPPNFQ